MSEHYFTDRPRSKAKPGQFTVELRGRSYTFHTDAGVFSRTGLDLGTEILIEMLPGRPGDVVLDLGCGYGALGIAAADLVGPAGHAYLVDVNERAVELAAQNIKANGILNATALKSDGLRALPGLSFDLIASNPPIRAGKKVVYRILREGYEALRPGGRLLVVIRTKQGAKSLARYLEELAGNCETLKRKSGYRILQVVNTPPPE
ncbi:MAG TPA: class I SAM-dependent methyltransferase [Firmicutes bacterium]|nr:class I SAM-dependent methyltransferase [Bacillota bacterium]